MITRHLGCLFFVRYTLDLTQGFYLISTFHERVLNDECGK